MKRQVLVTSLIIAASTTWVTQPVKAISTGGMKIVAVAEGDCAVDSQTIVITDATTSCSISVAVTPAKKYIHAELIAPIDKRSTKNGWSNVNFMFGGTAYGGEQALFQISKRGKASLQFKKKTSDGCVIELMDTRTLVAFVTNSKSTQNPRYTAQAVSKPITVKYQLSIGANDCVARYGA
jgi:hypothetical protein